MTIRPMRLADIPAGLDLCRLSRWNQLAEDWRCFLDSPSAAGLLAERDGAVLGTVTFLRFQPAFTWLSMMLVHPDARRSGIGTVLMQSAVEALAAEPCIRLDATPLGEPLYRRFGFTGEYQLLRARANDKRSTATTALPLQAASLDEVLTRDREVFGADRGRLLASFYRRA